MNGTHREMGGKDGWKVRNKKEKDGPCLTCAQLLVMCCSSLTSLLAWLHAWHTSGWGSLRCNYSRHCLLAWRTISVIVTPMEVGICCGFCQTLFAWMKNHFGSSACVTYTRFGGGAWRATLMMGQNGRPLEGVWGRGWLLVRHGAPFKKHQLCCTLARNCILSCSFWPVSNLAHTS